MKTTEELIEKIKKERKFSPILLDKKPVQVIRANPKEFFIKDSNGAYSSKMSEEDVILARIEYLKIFQDQEDKENEEIKQRLFNNLVEEEKQKLINEVKLKCEETFKNFKQIEEYATENVSGFLGIMKSIDENGYIRKVEKSKEVYTTEMIDFVEKIKSNYENQEWNSLLHYFNKGLIATIDIENASILNKESIDEMIDKDYLTNVAIFNVKKTLVL